jgi:hypothetical protein
MPATRTVAAATVPVSVPWNPRSTNSCQGRVTMPIRPRTIAPPNIARSSISRLPRVSASRPQIGANTMSVVDVTTAQRLVHSRSAMGSVTPRLSERKNGTIGIEVLKPKSARTSAARMAQKVRFQSSAVVKPSP